MDLENGGHFFVPIAAKRLTSGTVGDDDDDGCVTEGRLCGNISGNDLHGRGYPSEGGTTEGGTLCLGPSISFSLYQPSNSSIRDVAMFIETTRKQCLNKEFLQYNQTLPYSKATRIPWYNPLHSASITAELSIE